MQTAATGGAVRSVGSGRRALAARLRTLPGVSAPSSVVRATIEIAVSIAQALAVVLMDRVPSTAARASAPTWSTPGSPCRKARNAESDRATSSYGGSGTATGRAGADGAAGSSTWVMRAILPCRGCRRTAPPRSSGDGTVAVRRPGGAVRAAYRAPAGPARGPRGEDAMTAPAPGWYQDPAGTGASRWGDGVSWTGHVHPPAAQSPGAWPAEAAPRSSLRSNPLSLAVLAVAVGYFALFSFAHVVIAGFLPVLLAARAVRAKEPLAHGAAVLAGGTLLFAVYELVVR